MPTTSLMEIAILQIPIFAVIFYVPYTGWCHNEKHAYPKLFKDRPGVRC